MRKSEVYSWRVASDVKCALEDESLSTVFTIDHDDSKPIAYTGDPDSASCREGEGDSSYRRKRSS